MSENKVALITGGTRGIGKSIAEKFARNGYDLVINYVSDKTDIASLQTDFQKIRKEIKVIFEKANVAEYTSCEKMVDKAIETFGKIDVLVNNAGITRDNLLMRMKQEEFDDVININLKGTFHMTKLVTPYMMKKRYGKIVNISSVVGISGNAGQSNYAASKAGMIGFTKSIAKELASRNILANCVAPGFIETDMTAVLSEQVKEAIYTQIPLKKMGTAEEVANAVYFLASEENSYMTGQVLNIDGGMIC